MNVADAVRAVVRDYPGGAEALAVRLGMPGAVLRSKINTRCTTHHLRLDEAVAISELTGDPRILRAFAAETGRIVLDAPCEADSEPSDMAVLELVAAVWAGHGELGGVIHRALADGVLTETEYELIKEATANTQTRLASLLRRLAGMVEPAQPGAEA